MQQIILTCNNCSGPLETSQSATMVNCPHCSAQLRIDRNGGVKFTSVLKQVARSADRLNESVDLLDSAQSSLEDQMSGLRVENAILTLDRRWDSEQDGLRLTTWRGAHVIPRWVNALGVLLMTILLSIGSYYFRSIRLITPLILLIGILEFIRHSLAANEYSRIRLRYENRRRELVGRLNSRRQRQT